MAEVEAVAGEQPAPAFGRRRDVLIVLPGLLLALILAMLDQLVVSTALPRIVGDLAQRGALIAVLGKELHGNLLDPRARVAP